MKLKRKNPNSAMWVVSNCVEHRMNYIKELMKHLKVSAYGLCFQKTIEQNKKSEEMTKHKFYFSFENSFCMEYVSEKFWFALEYGTVPVVNGGLEFEHARIAPPNSFINAKDFETPKDLADYLNFLNQNDEEYKKYLAWRRHYDAKAQFAPETLCDICEK